MSYAKMSDYARPDGSIDWKRYDAAEMARGAKCSRCQAMIVFPNGSPIVCGDCKLMDGREEVNHDDFIRCPACGHRDRISDWDDYGEAKYGDGEHDVECSKCEHCYVITTHASYSYTSPARR